MSPKVWESAAPPTHIWERYPKKMFFFYTFLKWKMVSWQLSRNWRYRVPQPILCSSSQLENLTNVDPTPSHCVLSTLVVWVGALLQKCQNVKLALKVVSLFLVGNPEIFKVCDLFELFELCELCELLLVNIKVEKHRYKDISMQCRLEQRSKGTRVDWHPFGSDTAPRHIWLGHKPYGLFKSKYQV